VKAPSPRPTAPASRPGCATWPATTRRCNGCGRWASSSPRRSTPSPPPSADRTSSFTEARLREAYQRPDASLADFLRHILDVAKLPSREAKISQAFDDWVRRHPSLTATQLLFVRTLRKAVMQRAEIASLDALRKPPFTAIGDPETLFDQPELGELLDLVDAIAA
jgi:hypothetical protein